MMMPNGISLKQPRVSRDFYERVLPTYAVMPHVWNNLPLEIKYSFLCFAQNCIATFNQKAGAKI